MTTALEPGFEINLATLLVGVDTLCGGNVGGSSAERFILDTWSSGKQLPPIYHDTNAALLRRSNGASPTTRDTVCDFVVDYELRDLPAQVRCDAADFAPARRAYVNHLCTALDVILQTMFGHATGEKMPSFDERRAAVLLSSSGSVVIDPAPAREVLREALEKAGYGYRTGGNLRENVVVWRDQRVVPVQSVGQKMAEIKTELTGLLRERILSRLTVSPPNYWPRLEDTPFTNHTLRFTTDQHYTGFSQYDGGTDTAGVPALHGLFEFNTDHPVTRENLYHLVAHEVLAHYPSQVMCDLGYRSGRLPFEATVGTMCTPSTMLEEGTAENMLYTIFGSRQNAIDALGADLAVVLALNDLENIAKNNVGILRLREGWQPNAVKQYVAEQCVQQDSIVDKMSRDWASNIIIAPMYGPAYYHGTEVVSNALARYGPMSVARVGFHFDGLVDHRTFEQHLSS
ncbi:MAG: hypothetical protein Q7R76_01635 [Candidatus Woesearchaeota archaeon]|nr:hypothetical protein [Candidatus Woesearchaeota archaeon]